jgi:DNA processing protein
MCTAERAAWLRLALSPGIGPIIAQRLLREFGLPTALFAPAAEHGPDAREASTAMHARLAALCGAEAADELCGPPRAPLRASLQRAEAWLDGAPGRFLLTLADTDYPQALLALRDAPMLLYGEGRRELLQLPAMAIVGSRNGTRQGLENAANFAAHLGRAGLCIVSGLARGIDGAAHRGALDAGCATIALLGTGSDIVYPSSYRRLAAQLAQDGLMLSEYPIGTAPLAQNFPRRNRLIAGLARGVLVVEAALPSGSLITAQLAAELGREVCAIPGSIHSPLSHGCHRLIREGARLVESAADVLDELGWDGGAARQARVGDMPAAAVARLDRLLEALGHDPVHIDALTLRSGQAPGAVAARLLELELAGAVERLPGNRYQRVSGAATRGHAP